MAGMASPTLNDLIEINREIAALVRAGVPLELGLRSLAGSSNSRFDALAARLAIRLANGRSLSEAFANEGPAVSPIYAAVIEAGMHSGSLSEALEAVATSSKVIQEIRQRFTTAMIYPLICLGVAYLLSGFVFLMIVPRWELLRQSYRFIADERLERIFWLRQTMAVWYVWLPLSVVGLVLIAAIFRHGATLNLWNGIVSLGWMPGYGSVRRALEQTRFLELLALQTAFGTPLEAALPIAAAATEDAALQRDVARIVAALQAGRPLHSALGEARSLPASWRWTLASSASSGLLPKAIRQLADFSQHRSRRLASWFTVVVPTAVALACASVIVAGYVSVVFLPVISLWKGLGLP